MKDEIKEYIKEQIDKCYVIEHKDFEKVDLSKLLDYITNLQEENERLRKREKKWEKWTTEKEILSTKMSEYLCKWKNIKREYKNQVESNRLKKQEIERLNNIIKPKEVNYNYLKLLFEEKNKEEVIKSYVYKCEQLEKLYKSYEEKEIEVMKKDNIIDELEKFMQSDDGWDVENILDKLKELKGENNDNN